MRRRYISKVDESPRWNRIARSCGDLVANLVTDMLPFIGLVVAAGLLAFGALWATGHFEPQTPAQRAGYPDPPPTCERGELPRRIYLSRGDTVMTCAVRS